MHHRSGRIYMRNFLFGVLLMSLAVVAVAQDDDNDTICSAEDGGACQAKTKPRAEILETINTEWGEPQVILDIDGEATHDNIRQTQRYITTHASWKHTCQNRHYLCSFWAATNECTKNSKYMAVS
jgi:hypothetical protein